jgi:hypothetical protein
VKEREAAAAEAIRQALLEATANDLQRHTEGEAITV